MATEGNAPDEDDELSPEPTDSETVDPAEVLDPPTLQAVQAMIQGFYFESFSSPAPPPRILGEYNQALDNGADRVVSMVERQAAHRQRMESRGQLFGFTFAMVALIGGVILLAIGADIGGLIALVGALAGVGGLFIYNEVQTRRRQLPPRQVEPQHDD